MTVSLSAVAGLIVFYILYFNFKYKGRSKGKLFVLFFVAIIVFHRIWRNGSGISFVDNVLLRIKRTIDIVDAGDYGKATSGRTEIWLEYMQVFKESKLLTKLFGTGYLNQYRIQNFSHYAHNSYIDILLLSGMFGSALIFCKCITSIFRKKTHNAVYSFI